MENTRETQRQRPSPDDWRRIFVDWKASGMTQPDYCKAKAISLHTFNYWRSRLARAKKAASFQSVKIKAATPAKAIPPRAPIHLRLPNGVIVIIPPTSDQESLKSLLSLLGVTSC